MANAKKTADETVLATEDAAKKTAEAEDDRVEIFVHKGGLNEDPNAFISVNGVNYLLPKGKKSRVPRFVAEEYERSLRAQEKQDENIDKMATQPK